MIKQIIYLKKLGLALVPSEDPTTKKIVKGKKVIHGLTAHVFRHNYATMLYYTDVPVKDALYLLGHSNIKITLDIYTHLDKNNNNISDKFQNISEL